MRFEVPQFIDIEDKIFGPLTFKQFIYLAGGAGLGYVAFKILPSIFSYLGGLAFIGLGLLFAFYKINNQTFIDIAQAYVSYQIKGKLYIWKRIPKTDINTVKQQPLKIPEPPQKNKPNVTIADLAKNLDILDSYH